ncbi:HAD family phosphatase, partial [Candidatus Thioglobus sp.]|nr:HAD family phosphatase [Candidatus Thioglobus sp.]
FLAWKAVLGEYGISIEASDYYPLEGMGLQEIARTFVKDISLNEAAIEELVQRKKKYYVERQVVTFFPGVESLVSELKDQKIPMAIVTAGHLDQLRLSVPQYFLNYFNALIAGDMVARSKPDPEPYLLGAEGLGLMPQDCIAIENAPLGIQSARRANIYCIGVCSTVNRNELAEADEIVTRFTDLRNSNTINKILNPKQSNA